MALDPFLADNTTYFRNDPFRRWRYDNFKQDPLRWWKECVDIDDYSRETNGIWAHGTSDEFAKYIRKRPLTEEDVRYFLDNRVELYALIHDDFFCKDGQCRVLCQVDKLCPYPLRSNKRNLFHITTDADTSIAYQQEVLVHETIHGFFRCIFGAFEMPEAHPLIIQEHERFCKEHRSFLRDYVTDKVLSAELIWHPYYHHELRQVRDSLHPTRK